MDLDEQYLGLKTLVTVRLNKLNEANELYQYLKEVDELADWINEQIQIASSEEFGHDLEHLQVMANLIWLWWYHCSCNDGDGDRMVFIVMVVKMIPVC